jgi:hypothetical protein
MTLLRWGLFVTLDCLHSCASPSGRRRLRAVSFPGASQWMQIVPRHATQERFPSVSRQAKHYISFSKNWAKFTVNQVAGKHR